MRESWIEELEYRDQPHYGYFERSDLELDWLTINGRLLGFNARRKNDRAFIGKYLENLGLKEVKVGNDWALYETETGSISAFFSNYPLNNKKLSLHPTVKFDFSGHFWIHDNAILLARKIVLDFLKKFGSVPSISRVDIRQDIYGATNPFDYFPDFTHQYRYHWALRSKPNVTYYTDGIKDKMTGFSVSTSRYSITSYDRQLSLDKKYEKGQITKAYFNHYKEIYQERDVQRLEVRLKHDACDTFEHFFLHRTFDKETILVYSMANFGRNHAIKNIDTSVPSNRKNLEVNAIFSELFYLEEKENFKKFRSQIEKRSNIKISEMTFNKQGRTDEEIAKMFAKKICHVSSAETINQIFIDLDRSSNRLLKNLASNVLKFRSINDDRLERLKRTLAAYDLSEEELEEAHNVIMTEKNQLASFPEFDNCA